ncbi:MAG: D-alanyl-D-alanine carboxypeptidase, partial [Pseudomonadota bacterium]
MGREYVVELVLRDDIQLGAHRSEQDAFAAEIEYKVAPAPIMAGDKLADLVISQSGTEVGRYPLYAEGSVARKGFFGRAGAALLQKIRGE